MGNKTLNVALTKSQVDNLVEFVELNFIQSIRDDTGVDNIDYVVDMMDALKTLRLASKSVSDTKENSAVKE